MMSHTPHDCESRPTPASLLFTLLCRAYGQVLAFGDRQNKQEALSLHVHNPLTHLTPPLSNPVSEDVTARLTATTPPACEPTLFPAPLHSRHSFTGLFSLESRPLGMKLSNTAPPLGYAGKPLRTSRLPLFTTSQRTPSSPPPSPFGSPNQPRSLQKS